MYDDLFRDLNRAVVKKQEIRCFKQEVNGRIRWVVEIDDPYEAKRFESRILGFLKRMKEKSNVSNNSEETI